MVREHPHHHLRHERSRLLPAVLTSGCVRTQDQTHKRCRSYGVQAGMGDMFGGRFEDKEHAIEVFEGWNEEAKERVPAERLLVYEVKEGWGPLCEFLGVGKRQASHSRASTTPRSSEGGSGAFTGSPS